MEFLICCCLSLSRVWLHNPMYCSMPGFLVPHHLLEFAWVHVQWIGDAIQWSSVTLFSFCLNLPSIRVLSNESTLCILRWPKYWSFSFSISPSKDYLWLIFFKIDWFDLFAFQGTLKSLFQHHSLKASIFQCSAFFIVQFSHPYMTTGRTTGLIIWIFVGKVRSLLFNTLSRFVIAFLPRSNCFLISRLQSPSTVILEPKKRKSVTASTFSPPICHKVVGPYAMILVFWILSFKLVFLTLLLHPHQEAL